MIPTLSAKELKKLADTIKRRRLQLVRPATPKPRDRLQPLLERTQWVQQEPQPATGDDSNLVAPRPGNQVQQKKIEDDEELMLRRLLYARRLTANRVDEAGAARNWRTLWWPVL